MYVYLFTVGLFGPASLNRGVGGQFGGGFSLFCVRSVHELDNISSTTLSVIRNFRRYFTYSHGLGVSLFQPVSSASIGSLCGVISTLYVYMHLAYTFGGRRLLPPVFATPPSGAHTVPPTPPPPTACCAPILCTPGNFVVGREHRL